MNALSAAARGLKDEVLSSALRVYLNDRFSGYGRAEQVQVNTRRRRVVIVAMLDGEREQVTAVIESYQLQKEGGDHFLIPDRFSSSRAWLSRLLTELFSGKRYRLPAAIGRLL